MTTISINIPAYRTIFLKEAIVSIIQQSYKNWELIIVDDCSPEDIRSMVEPYLRDSRIHYYRNKINFGALNVVDNWNKCLSLCTGKYVMCIGDDDKLLPNCLTEYSKVIKKYPNLNVYHGRTNIIDEKDRIITTLEERNERESINDMLEAQWTREREQFIGDFLFSRDWLASNNGYVNFPLAYSSDWATANLAAKETGIANVNVPVFEYRDNRNSISRSQNLKQTVLACNEVYWWYKDFIAGIDASNALKNAMEKYYLTKEKDMIYLDFKNDHSISNLFYWIKKHSKLLLNTTEILQVCTRAALADLR